MKKKIIALFALVLANSLYASWPMESVDMYNIVLVHGAADRWQGLDCENGDGGNPYTEAYSNKQGVVTDPSTCHLDSVEVPVPNESKPDSTRDSVFTRCDTAYYNPKRIGGVMKPNGDIGGMAVGMIKDLFPFLNDELFENPYAAYLQRPFVLPAGSPANNADEIGKSNWMGSGMCSARRSLIEEAKEFKAHGQDTLKMFRESPTAEYRKIASRNILVGHSMGGVAIREYVQGPNYNKDVDKIVTLDSPHEGTGSLNMLLALKERIKSGKKVTSEAKDALLPLGIAMVHDPMTVSLGLEALVSAYIIDVVQVAVDSAIIAILNDKGGFDYYFDDPLADYIDPNKDGGVKDLVKRETPDMPMIRILGGEHSMVFTDPEDYTVAGPLKGILPDEVALPTLNAWTFLGESGDKSTDYVNALAGFIFGLVGGVAVMDRGTALVPEWSSYGDNTKAFNAAGADVKKVRYEAALHARGYNPLTDTATWAIAAVDIEGEFAHMAAAVHALVVSSNLPIPEITTTMAIAMAITGAANIAKDIVSSTTGAVVNVPVLLAAVSDLQESHKIPAEGDFHREHFGEDRSYSIINGGSATARSYLMEDFLYEKPFVNLALSVSDPALRAVEPGCYYEADSAGKQQLCEVGLYDSLGNVAASSNGKMNYADFRKLPPLRFKSESDWSRVGLKLDRWERVDGLGPSGDSVKIPIRHVERYSVPDIVVDSFIVKYSFVIDDLMPHRLRQIRLNFNYQEEIAWECDVTKDPLAGDACTVYKRSGGSGWDTLQLEKHPVQKDGRFDFEPRKYNYTILSALQKDNQNTVTISTVNKIGLSNTQRLYYLFKATANKLDPVWPQRDVVLNKIKGFASYASALGYQGFRVKGAKDTIFRTDGTSSFSRLDMDMTIDSVYDASRVGQPGVSPTGFVYDSSSAYFASRQHDSDPAEGNYLWKFVANIRNTAAVSAGADSNTYEVPFRVDRTAPDFTLEPERSVMNPDSTMFMARYAWAGDSAQGPDIFAMRLTLEKFSNASSSGSPVFTKVAELRPYADVISPEFAIQWDASSLNTVRSRGDGLYRVRAYAADYAVPDTVVYGKMLSLYDSIILGGTVSDNMWPVASDSMNTTTRFAEFYVDRSAPVISNVSVTSDSGATSIYSTLTRPQRNSQYAYATGDSLAKITYRVAESLNGRDSVPVTVAWNFVHVGDTTAMDRAGDSVWVKSSGTASATWREGATMRLMDGDYAIRALARDAAGNTARYTHSKTLRVDRTPPHIVSLVSTRLVYPDSAGPFSATIAVDEKYDAPTNRTGMRCYYNVSGCGRTAPSLWKPVSNNVLHGDSLTFSLDSVVGTHGKCYLNAVCVDAAGNASARTDLFYIGERTPVITSPKSIVATPLVAITGVAPPRGGNDSLHTVYRIRYAAADTTGSGAPLAWNTAKVSVVSAIRNDTLPYVSKISQSEDGVLGYIDRSLGGKKYLEGTYVIELGTCAGPECLGGADSLWLTDTMTVLFNAPQDSLFGDTLHWKLVLDPKSVHVGQDTLGVSLVLSGDFNGSYFARVYAKDSKGVGMFDESVNKVWKNPYYGSPADTLSDSSAVWFYELDDGYHLQWRGLAAGDSLRVSFDSAGFGGTCMAPDAVSNLADCSVRTGGYDLSSLYSAASWYLEDFSKWLPPSVVNGEMLVSGDSGHVVMKATNAFRISRAGNLGDTALPKMRVYFGENARDGFYWVANGSFGSDTLNPLAMGWTVNPQTYGLKFRWPGFPETGMYPASGTMKVYMEITENVVDNPRMYLDSQEVDITLDSVKVVLPSSLPDYVLLKNDSTLVCKSPTDPASCEKRVMWLKTMVAKYGVKNRDAWVKVTVSDASGPVAVLQDDSSTILRANASDSAYQVRWNGKNNLSTAELKEGTYTLTVVATAVDGSGADTASATFNAKFAETMYDLTPADPTDENYYGPAIHISEAKYDTSVKTYRYEPVADYLVKAEVSGYDLPADTLAKGISLQGQITGTQEILGYEPKRFNLAIKRHRKELNLVVITHFYGELDEITGSTILGASSCSEEDSHDIINDFDIHRMTFSEYNRDTVLNIHKNRSGRGFDGENGPSSGYMEIIVLTEMQFEQFNLSKISSQSQFDALKGEAVWNLKNYIEGDTLKGDTLKGDTLKRDSVFHIPGGSSGNILYGSSKQDDSCKPKFDSLGMMVSSCKDSTDNYNPNKNLFEITFAPIDDSRFYSDKGLPNPDCADYERYRFAHFNITFLIPNSYWNSDFGMDNLVNRTVRFDHTNISLFGDDGYWAALDSLGRVQPGSGNYFDGDSWVFDMDYGLLTPFETQYLPYYASNTMPGGLNTFLFPDEDALHSQAARFDLHFYGANAPGESFVTKVLGAPDAGEDTSACSYDSTNIFVATGGYPYCQIEHDGTDSVKHTPYFAANSNVSFYVGLNKRLGSVNHKVTVAFPQLSNWVNTSADSVCSDTNDWKFVIDGSKPCYKYYGYGSRVHYYYGDFTDSVWGANMIRPQDGTIRNLTNDPYFVFRNSQNVLKSRLLSMGTVGSREFSLSVVPDPNDYDPANHRFVVSLDTVRALVSLKASELTLSVDTLYSLMHNDSLSLAATYDTLYIKARSMDTNVIYRKADDKLAQTPVRPKSVKLSSSQLYAGGSVWMKNIAVKSAQVLHLDSSDHSHLQADGNFPSFNDLEIGFKDSIAVKRPKELVEIRAYLRENEKYQLAYLNGNAFYVVPRDMLDSMWRDSIKTGSSGWYRLGWFDVNRLQGNTQFLLMWGDGSGASNIFSKFDMVIGRAVDSTGGKTVKSLFEEVNVTFPAGSLAESKDITVRTIDAKDYPFEVFNNLALKGPIVEVLPSMPFTNDSVLPRIQMKISYDEMEAMNSTPETIRLYKVDTASKKFVPLEKALYGYLDANGNALVSTGDTVATCSSAKDLRCYDSTLQWAYLLISAETHSFSVFTAMDSAVAETPDFSVTVLPEVASAAGRHVRVDGITRFRLYIDDDSLWADQGDATPPVVLAFTADSNGFAQVTLPSRNKDIDTSFVFVVALSEPDTDGTVVELPAAPAVARALTVNTQFSCTVPADSLWLGLDNGYLAYGAACTHPGYGTVSLYRDGIVAAEIRGDIPDTVIYDGYKAVGMGKIAPGVYESRYLGVSALGLDMQLAGPDVHTDSARPVIVEWSVTDSSDVLDRLFVVNARLMDTESGVARVVVTPVFGGDTLRIVTAVPDSAGNVEIPVRLTRKRLTECAGCVLSIAFRAEDYGHNHVERMYTSPDKLYPYPAQVALWYPAREGVGNYAHEFLGTGHDLELSGMGNPWNSDVGLYFFRWEDSALGVDTVNAGTSDSYSFEARIKDGNAKGVVWRRILGFSGIGGLEISLEARNGSIRLVEGTHMWGSSKALLRDKEWVHVVVTVDSSMVRFYVDGSPVDSSTAVPLEREFYGVFSAGKTDSVSFIGNVADIRMYTSALSPEQVLALSLPVTDEGEEVSDLIVVAIKDMNAVSGFKREFSCSVAGNKYLTSVADAATVSLPVIVQDAAEYNVVLYARSATAGNVSVAVGESAMQTGVVAVSNVWHAVTLSGVTVNLAAGTHTLKLRVPKGVEIGGFALSTADIPASMIAWGTSTADKVAGVVAADTARKIKSYLRYEGYPETSTLRPRIRLRNVSSTPVNGFSVRYYFRGEDASQARVDRYVPNDVSTFPSVHLESGRTGYVEWKFPNKQIPVNGTVFNGDGPHFGLYNSDFFPWNVSDDPSFVDPTSGLVPNVDGFYEDVGIIVLDNDYNLIGGSCAEMEDPTSLVTSARALAAAERDNNQMTEVHIKVENTGNVPLGNIDVRYYFYVGGNMTPILDVYYLSGCSSVTLQNLGNGRWQATAHYNGSLAPGQMWNDPVKFALRLQNWEHAWNASDDPSHDGLGHNFVEAHGVCVYDSAGNLLYGNAPAWGNPASSSSGSGSGGTDPTNHPGNGSSSGNIPPIVRTDDGLLVTMDSYAYVSLKLVNAHGEPIRTLFRGNLQAGQNLVHVNWNGIDMRNSFLVFKVNGTVRSTTELSLL
ncbi:LamG-like jellyroll fold domain-containing protein [uncultured Fibrobacter sp.]|uniref:LamG-like jellyroll fold domain-containing protein n=1 Tax=uncultured Fibrobacter sp. TaxID=261512 RepID=UPI002621EEAE|nr:LamG-like jellyroll fold domain-containing protein [uncultured Fibrobacter sp.]